MRPGERPYIVTIEITGVLATSAEEAANYVRDRITLRATALHIPKHSHVRIVRALPQNPTISDAIHRGEAGAL